MSKIITTDELQTYMGKDLNAGAAGLIVEAVNAYIEALTGRCWGETKQLTRRFDYRRTVWLRDMDIVSIDGVQVGIPNETPQNLDEADYYFSDLGRLTVGSGFSSPHNRSDGRYVSVTYTHGVEQVPADLKLAALGIAAGNYNWTTTENKDASSVSVGSYKVEYKASSSDGSMSTADQNFATVRRYALRRV